MRTVQLWWMSHDLSRLVHVLRLKGGAVCFQSMPHLKRPPMIVFGSRTEKKEVGCFRRHGLDICDDLGIFGAEMEC